MKAFVSGAAGFIGSNLCDRLLQHGHEVVGYDNLSTGREEFMAIAKTFSSFQFVQGDLMETEKLGSAMKGCDMVFHLSANADIKDGLNHPFKDLQQNTIATYHVLEAMRNNDIKKIAFSSTGSVYGECKIIPTPEDAPFPIQTSLYAASKVAGENLIQAYCEGYGFQGWIFRFVSILGERYSHGHVYDFIKQLKKNPDALTVLGNGRQRKSYLYIQDCLNAIFTALEKADEKVNIFNLGTDESVEVNDSISYITASMALAPALSYTGGERGWVGDNPLILLDCKNIRSLGWKPEVTIKEAVLKTVTYLNENKWLFNEN